MDSDQSCCIGIVALVFIIILFSWDFSAGIFGTIVILIVIAGIYDREKSDKKAAEETENKRIKMEQELERFQQKEEEEKKIKKLKEKIKKMKDDGYNVDELEEKIKSYK